MPTLTDADTLLARFRAMQARAPHGVRARDAADSLGVSEGALTEVRRGSGEAVPLPRPPGPDGFATLMAGLHEVGEALALTRNAHCVHERTGRYGAPTVTGDTARIEGEIVMRLRLRQWHAAYALTEPTHAGVRPSIQVFDVHGDAVHKVYQTEATDSAAFQRLIATFAQADAPALHFAAAPAAGVAEVPPGRALGSTAMQHVLERAAEGQVPLCIVVGNRGCEQRFEGRVEVIKLTGPWLNVLDPRFNLHLRWDRIAATRLLSGDDGTGVSVFDARGMAFCRVTGADPAAPAWQGIAAALPVSH